jgi:hypothetical protein
MGKYLFCFAGLFFCAALLCSCGVSKITVQQNAIDSVIRKVEPAHNCNCDYTGKTVQVPEIKKWDVNNFYYWQQPVFVNSQSKTDYAAQAGKIKDELTTLIPTLKNYRMIFIEFRLNTTRETDTVFSSTNIGTAYFILNGCKGYSANKTNEYFIKSIKKRKDIIALCKTNN